MGPSDHAGTIAVVAIDLLAVSVATIAQRPLVQCTPKCQPLFRLGLPASAAALHHQ